MSWRRLCHLIKEAQGTSQAQEVEDRTPAPVILYNGNLSQLVLESQNNGRNKPGAKPLPVGDLVKTTSQPGFNWQGNC